MYSIDYPQINKKERPLTYMMLPKKQSYRFNEEWIATKIKKATFDLNVLAKQDKNFFYSDFKFNDKKYMLLDKNESIKSFLATIPKYDIEVTEEKDTMLGFNIQKAYIYVNGEKTEAWFTDEIAISNPNWFTPFKEIPGVLLKYVISQFGVRMEFKATSLEDLEEDYKFSFNEGGDLTNSDAYQNELKELFENLIKE